MQNLQTEQTLRIAGHLLKLIQKSGNTDTLITGLESLSKGISTEEEKTATEAFDSLTSMAGEKVVSQQKTDRGYLDGCYDLCHSGHFNAIRQAANSVHTLVIGLNSDEDIRNYKGPTVLSGSERVEIIKALKWGDETIADTPYEPSLAIFDQFNCEYYIHGDDPVMINGVNVCETFNEMGRYKEIRRTTGVSTTDLTGKLLNLLEQDAAQSSEDQKSDTEFFGNAKSERKPPKQTFLQTSTRISNFSNRREPKPDDVVVYFQLSCDLMHPGVIQRLKAAKEQGTYLYVGLWDDEMIRYYRGSKYPLQGTQERLLLALGVKFVDDVVIGAPYIVTDDLIKSLNITKVVHIQSNEDKVMPKFANIDPFEVPKAQNIFVELPPVENDMTVEDIAQRVQNNRADFEKKFQSKKAKQDDYYLNLKKSTSQMSSTGENPETPTKKVEE